MGSDALLTIGADDSALNAAMARMQESVQHGFESVKTSFEGVSAVFEKLNVAFVAIGTVLAGGKAFKEAVEGTVEMTKEANALSRTLGITVNEASILNVALGDIYQNSDTLVMATQKLTKQLKDNEGAFTALGVSTRDQQHHFRSSLDIMIETNQALLKFREGTDRNIEGQKIYGKAWSEVQPLLKLTTELMEESRTKAESLGLVIGKENVEATAKYRAAMNDVGDVFDGVSKVIGETVMPSLTEMANWFSGAGPQVVEGMRAAMQGFSAVMGVVKDVAVVLWDSLVDMASAIYTALMQTFGESGEPLTGMQFFKNVIKVVEIAFIGLGIGIQEACQVIALAVEGSVLWAQRLADVANKLIHLDFSGAATAWNAWGDKIEEVVRKRLQSMQAIAQRGGKTINDTIFQSLGDKPPTSGANGSGGGGANGSSGGGNSSMMQEWESRLSTLKSNYQRENDLREFSKQQELAYWQSILSTLNKGSKDYQAVLKKVADTELEIMKKSATERRGLSEQGIANAERIAQDELKLAQQGAEQDLAMDQISKSQFLEKQQAFEDRRYEIQQAAMEARKALLEGDPNHDPVALQKILDEMDGAYRAHELNLNKITNQMTLNTREQWSSMLQPITNAISTSVQGIILGTTTVRKALSNIWTAILGEFVSMLTKKVANWLASEMTITGISKAWSAIRQALGFEEAAVTVATKTGEAAAVVPANAAEAASGAAASQASIPYVGPALAAAAFAGTMALVMGAMKIFSASEGFNIPSGVNPMTQLHQEEMVLPSDIANPLRQSLAMGSGMPMGGGAPVTIQAMDSKDVIRVLKKNNALQRSLKDMSRRFVG